MGPLTRWEDWGAIEGEAGKWGALREGEEGKYRRMWEEAKVTKSQGILTLNIHHDKLITHIIHKDIN